MIRHTSQGEGLGKKESRWRHLKGAFVNPRVVYGVGEVHGDYGGGGVGTRHN
jgi:hypothetical protein